MALGRLTHPAQSSSASPETDAMGARDGACYHRRIGLMSTSLAKERDVTMHSDAASSSVSDARSRVLPLVVWLGFVAGFVVALIVIARPRWFPILDLAQTEMRVRDVFTTHPPLIGLPGRIGNLARQGSHPGPISFWALAPFYKLFGSSAWALQAATASLNAMAIGLSLMIARRRGGAAVQLGIASMLAVVTYYYGPSVLTQAWNPYLPMMWFMVVVLGVWSVLMDDLKMLPVATFAACFCLQTHISYLGLVGGLGALAAGWLAWSLRFRRNALGARPWRWIAISFGIVVVTSIPPIVQQLTHTPGNLTLIWEHFTAPPEDPIGLRAGLKILFVTLNPWRLLSGDEATTASVWPGIGLVIAWGVGVALALRRRARSLIALDAVIAVGLVLGLLSLANIFGFVWYYLMRWAWGLNALMLFATGWAAVVAFGRRVSDSTTATRWLAVALALVTAGYLVGFAVDSSTVEPPTPRVSSALGVLVQPTIRAIDSDRYPGGGRGGRYQVSFVDPVTINAPGYGLLSELERAGLHVGLSPVYAAIVRPQRVVTKHTATGVVHLSVGHDIARWERKRGARRIATADLRTPSERREFARLQRTVRRELISAGRSDLVPNLTDNIFTATFVTNIPVKTQRELKRMLDIGEPSAVFIGPRSLAE